jgi:hypothetical protein
MQYQVPQFIEVEDKIFEKITLKQFIYLAGGAGLSFLIYKIAGSLIIAAIPILIVLSFSIALAWYRLYSRFPFIEVVEWMFKYFTSSRLYIWKKVDKKPSANPVKEVKEYASILVPKISDSKLKDLTWSLDIKDSVYSNKNQN